MEETTGVLSGSYSYLYTPSKNACDAYFYPVALGHFICSTDYCTERLGYNSFLLLMVHRGALRVTCSSEAVTLHTGSVMLIDCYQYHKYFAVSPLTFSWIHFDGICARSYYEILRAKGLLNVCVSNLQEYDQIFQKISRMFHKSVVQEAMLSKHITDMLTLMQTTVLPQKNVSMHFMIENIISYINGRLDKELTLTELAERCSLSPYYFLRVFKRETGYTPHEFILLSRMNKARYELTSTDFTIAEIGDRCGFSSSSHFCTSFKKLVGVTPLEYREGRENT